MATVTNNDVDDIALSFDAECGFCGAVINESIDKYEFDSIEDAIAATLNSEGWEMVESEKFQMVCLSCPGCAEMEDSDRGE